MHGMSKSTFKVTQINGRDAVVLSISEVSKNHRDDKDAAYGGVMPSFPSSDLCPVKSFTKYLKLPPPRLHKSLAKTERLLQTMTKPGTISLQLDSTNCQVLCQIFQKN